MWLGGLWYAAPLVSSVASGADRLRNTLFLGVAFPALLGVVGLLYAPLLFAVLGVAASIKLILTARGTLRHHTVEIGLPEGAVCAAVMWVAWPALAQPLLDGDSLAYHLPNAAAWAQSHSLWTSGTRYWWYPPSSELFASGLFLTGGIFSLGLAGTAALVLLAWRLIEYGRHLGVNAWMSVLFAAAVVTAFPFALQAANLENDVWLAAFFLESTVVVAETRGAAWPAFSVLALTKPTGLLYALIALGVRRRRTFAIATGVPLTAWFVHDAILWPTALVPPASTAVPNIASTTIIAHGVHGMVTLARAVLEDGPMTVALVALSFAGALSKIRRIPLLIIASWVIFLCAPFGFDNGVPQLANGHSLRFLLPALSLGALYAVCALANAPLPALVSRVVIAANIVVLVYNGERVQNIFWNDANTRDAYIAAVALLALAYVSTHVRNLRPSAVLGLVVLIAIAQSRARSHPLDYFNAQVSTPAEKSRAFSWLAEQPPGTAVTLGLNSGAVIIANPRLRVIDGLPNDACEIARQWKALLVQEGSPLSCGDLVYAGAVVSIRSMRE